MAARAPFKLAMAASDFGFGPSTFRARSTSRRTEKTFSSLDKGDDIVVYCSNVDCNASHAAIKALRERGYDKVSHYPGGLIDWENAGLPLEGDWADASSKGPP